MNRFKITPVNEAVEAAGIPPVPAAKVIPQWYKDIPQWGFGETKLSFPMDRGSHNATVKRCMPFLDGMTAGYTVLLHDDVFVEQLPTGPLMRWKSSVEMITWHSQDQFEGIPIPANYHPMVAKWHNDYFFDTPKGYSMLCTHPVNRFDLPFLTITGLVDTDAHPLTVQFPFFLKSGFEGIIESGTPVAQLIPIKRESWKAEVEKYDRQSAYKRQRSFTRTFAGSYKKNFWSKKQYL
jgi:hypothetical protein